MGSKDFTMSFMMETEVRLKLEEASRKLNISNAEFIRRAVLKELNKRKDRYNE